MFDGQPVSCQARVNCKPPWRLFHDEQDILLRHCCGDSNAIRIALLQGIVSGLGRELATPGFRGVPIKNVIQTDAAINPGNSGGVLLDSKGRLIGINTAIADPTGAAPISSHLSTADLEDCITERSSSGFFI